MILNSEAEIISAKKMKIYHIRVKEDSGNEYGKADNNSIRTDSINLDITQVRFEAI